VRAVAFLLLLPALTAAATEPPIQGGPLGLLPGYDEPRPSFAWQGAWQSAEVRFPSQASGAMLFATVFAPAPLPEAPVPAVVMLPGSIVGVQAGYHWAARDLAGHGYLAVTVDPQGVGKSDMVAWLPCEVPPCGDVGQQPWFISLPSWLDALDSSLGFLASPENPYRAVTDPGRLGAAGHSLGAHAVSVAQQRDPRLDAIVAWDNLVMQEHGDDGSAKCVGSGPVIAPRLPAMGQAGEACGFQAYDAKATAFDAWRAAGIPSMELVFRGEEHINWSQKRDTNASFGGAETSLHRFAHYGRAWFDLWLRGDASAPERLLAGLDLPRADMLSARFRSGAYLPAQGIDCPDLAVC
jgi:dienelactone hydrolase